MNTTNCDMCWDTYLRRLAQTFRFLCIPTHVTVSSRSKVSTQRIDSTYRRNVSTQCIDAMYRRNVSTQSIVTERKVFMLGNLTALEMLFVNSKCDKVSPKGSYEMLKSGLQKLNEMLNYT